MGKNKSINTEQIELMFHAIGLRRDRIKRYKYEAFRNYFTTSNPDPLWDDLVQKGYALSNKFPHGVGDNPMCYSVSQKGFDLLENITFLKITEME